MQVENLGSSRQTERSRFNPTYLYTLLSELNFEEGEEISNTDEIFNDLPSLEELDDLILDRNSFAIAKTFQLAIRK